MSRIDLPTPIQIDLQTGSMGHDSQVQRSAKVIGQMSHIFADEAARASMDQTQRVYAVEYWQPVPDGTEGGLFWGNSTVLPGVVGDEYFMTQGHFHQVMDRAELYSTVSGVGMLVLMDEQREGTVQEMRPGSTHYIPGRIAHRVVNVGAQPLTFLACWPSDAGYDYATIHAEGFSLRILREGNRPVVRKQA